MIPPPDPILPPWASAIGLACLFTWWIWSVKSMAAFIGHMLSEKEER